MVLHICTERRCACVARYKFSKIPYGAYCNILGETLNEFECKCIVDIVIGAGVARYLLSDVYHILALFKLFILAWNDILNST